MSRIVEIILNITLVIGAQIIVYVLFLRPKISTWGTVGNEATMPLIGDDLAPAISATRAISIRAPISEVWKWIIQWGQTGEVSSSYSFLERVLGYEMREAEPIPEFQEMEVGRIIPDRSISRRASSNTIFDVVDVEPGNSFVLETWGTFMLKEIHPKLTRLIVRTRRRQLRDLKSKIDDFVFMALHYTMERRMLIGIKARVEGIRLSETSDHFWLLGVFFSCIGIALMIFLGSGVLNTFLSVIYGIAWLLVLLILEPKNLNTV